MKRILLCLALLLVPSLTRGATCTFGDEGDLWTTGSSCAPPTNGDDCTISANIEVIMDAAAGECGTLTVTGALRFKEGTRTLTIGDGAGAKADTVTIGAAGELSWGAGQDFMIDTDNTTPANNGRITNNGTLIARGRVLAAGRISEFTDPDASNPRAQTITDYSLKQRALDEFNGKLFVPTSGFFRWQTFAITTGATTRNQIILNADSRGAYDTRNKTNRVNPTAWAAGDWGEVYSTGVVTTSGSPKTTLTFGTAFSNLTRAKEVLQGSRFICNADLNTIDDADFERVCSVTSTTVATLCSEYGTTNCDAGAAYRVYDDNQPPFAASIQESFSAGDTYLILEPAVLSIPVAARVDTTAPTESLGILANDGSTTILYGVDLGWCGYGLATGDQDCIDINSIDNTNSNEGFYLDLVDMHHFSGIAGINVDDSANITFKRSAIRDAAEGGDVSSSNEAHAISINDNSGGGRVTNLIFEDMRIVRSNDDIFTITIAGEGDDVACDGCIFRRLFAGFTPTSNGGSVEGWEPSKRMTNFIFDSNFFSNVQGNVFAYGTIDVNLEVNGYVRNSILQNSQTAHLFVLDNAVTAPIPSIMNVTLINSVLRGNFDVGSAGGALNRGKIYHSFIDLTSRQGGTGILSPHIFRGNVVVGPKRPPTASGNILDWLTTAYDLQPNTVTVTDNAFFTTQDISDATVSSRVIRLGSTSQPAGKAQSVLFDHNLIYCTEHLFTTGIWRALTTNAPDSSYVHTITNNIFANCQGGIDKSAGSGTISNDYNLFWGISSAFSGGPSAGTNDLTTGVELGLGNAARYEAFLVDGATPFSSPAADGSPRGPRVAGPVLQPLLSVYPFLTDETDSDGDGKVDTLRGPIPFINNVGAADADGDGIFSLFDNCPNRSNPTQADLDQDGTGDACE